MSKMFENEGIKTIVIRSTDLKGTGVPGSEVTLHGASPVASA